MIAPHLFGMVTLLLAGAANNPPPAEAVFVKRLPNSEEYVPIQEATFDDNFCIRLKGFASDGEHVAEIAIYDASGREISRFIKTVIAKGATWRLSICPSALPDVDAPGEWWFVSTLDDVPVISVSMRVNTPSSRYCRMNTLPSLASITSSTPSGAARFTRVSTGR